MALISARAWLQLNPSEHHTARPPLPRSQAVYNHRREFVRILRRPGRRDDGSAEEFMFKKKSDRQLEAPAKPVDLVTIMERHGNRRPIFALASWTAERPK